jgi:hypothetical protein
VIKLLSRCLCLTGPAAQPLTDYPFSKWFIRIATTGTKTAWKNTGIASPKGTQWGLDRIAWMSPQRVTREEFAKAVSG